MKISTKKIIKFSSKTQKLLIRYKKHKKYDRINIKTINDAYLLLFFLLFIIEAEIDNMTMREEMVVEVLIKCLEKI